VQRDEAAIAPTTKVFTSTASDCAATYTLGQAPRLGPGRLADGRILLDPVQISTTLPYPTPLGKGWSFHAGRDGSGLLAKPSEGTLLDVVPVPLLPQTAGLFNPKPLDQWIEVAKAIPPCGFNPGWTLPWFEAFEPSPEAMHGWNRWCLGWLLHHQDAHQGGGEPAPGLYVSIQAGHLESNGHVQVPRVQVHTDVARADPTLVERASARLHDVLAGQPIGATLRQHAAPRQTARLLGSSQLEPLPTSTHARVELVWEALHAAQTASISSAVTPRG
jgi:hypothetical protein